MWSIGVADIATLNQPFVALVASVLPFEANPSQFFAVFDSLGVITTHLDAPNSRSGRFRVNDDDDNDNDNNNRRTKRLLNPLLRMRARGNDIITAFSKMDAGGGPETVLPLGVALLLFHVFC